MPFICTENDRLLKSRFSVSRVHDKNNAHRTQWRGLTSMVGKCRRDVKNDTSYKHKP